MGHDMTDELVVPKEYLPWTPERYAEHLRLCAYLKEHPGPFIPIVCDRTPKYWLVLPSTFTPDSYYDKVKEKWMNVCKGIVAIRDETPIMKYTKVDGVIVKKKANCPNYLKGWVACEDGVKRYCLAPIPGSYNWKALMETVEVIK
jgi:hypothetical protein